MTLADDWGLAVVLAWVACMTLGLAAIRAWARVRVAQATGRDPMTKEEGKSHDG